MTERITALGSSAPTTPTYTFEGTTYTFTVVSQSIMAAMEAKLLARKVELLATLKPLMAPEEFAKKRDALHASAEKECSFESKAMQEYLDTKRGMVEMVALVMGADEDTVLRMVITDGEKVTQHFQTVAAMSAPARKAGGRTPKKARTRKAKLLTRVLA